MQKYKYDEGQIGPSEAEAPASSLPNQPQQKPSAWNPLIEFRAIIEWQCGQCHKIVYYACWSATYCPHCGAPIFNLCQQKLDKPQYRGWAYHEQHAMAYSGPERKVKR